MCYPACRYGFRSPPHLELKARPKLGEREVTLGHVTEWIEKKLDQEFQVQTKKKTDYLKKEGGGADFFICMHSKGVCGCPIYCITRGIIIYLLF